MTTVLDVIKAVTAGIGLNAPSAVYGAPGRDAIEFGALANEMAQRIAYDTIDWAMLKKTATLTGDGTATTFALPGDYRRMLKTTKLRSSTTPSLPLEYVDNLDIWIARSVQGFASFIPAWTVIDNAINVSSALAADATIKFGYLSNAIIIGTDQLQFTDDTDVFKLDARLLKLGMIWQWKASKGLAYDDDLQNYNIALELAAAAAAPRKLITIGRERLKGQRLSSNGSLGYPFGLLTEDNDILETE